MIGTFPSVGPFLTLFGLSGLLTLALFLAGCLPHHLYFFLFISPYGFDLSVQIALLGFTLSLSLSCFSPKLFPAGEANQHEAGDGAKLASRGRLPEQLKAVPAAQWPPSPPLQPGSLTLADSSTEKP